MKLSYSIGYAKIESHELEVIRRGEEPEDPLTPIKLVLDVLDCTKERIDSIEQTGEIKREEDYKGVVEKIVKMHNRGFT